jgi:hypothetical protein
MFWKRKRTKKKDEKDEIIYGLHEKKKIQFK